MNTPESLNDLHAKLIRRGLPADYAERAAAEIADHYCDLVAEFEAAGVGELQAANEAHRRLGDERTLVKKTVREYQRRYWCARWPLVTFLLAPLPMWIATYIIVALIVRGALSGLASIGFFDGMELYDSVWESLLWLRRAITMLLFVGVPALMVLGLARLASRAALGWRWTVLAACVLAISVGSVRMERSTTIDPQTMARVPDAQYRIWVNVPLIDPGWWTRTGWHRWYGGHPLQACHFLVPLAAAGILLARARQLTLRAERLAIVGDDFQGGKNEHARIA
jgi:hypothetical protein